MNELFDIQTSLQKLLKEHVPPLQVRKEQEQVFEVAGTKEAMQGKQKVDGFYFASVVPKPKDIRLYFFPIYTDPKEFEWISEDLRKCLKGKSCFHIKSLDQPLFQEMKKMIRKGVEIYLLQGLI